MRSLSLISLFLLVMLIMAFQLQDSPHGKNLKYSCELCHSAESWKFMENSTFNHSATLFPLLGQHQATGCKQCHASLIFSEAETECVSCHTDMHNQSVGNECSRCHTPQSWIVNNIIEIHQLSRFPLTGPHMTAQCSGCHVSASALYFEPLGVECIDCHITDYESTTDPAHSSAGFSTDCLECHRMNAFSWSGTGINHNFFPLTRGHDISDCSQCHVPGDYSNISPACFSCHEPNYNSTSNPSHQLAGISTNCSQCHTTDPGWKPATYYEHDGQYFPVYSGKHGGTWDNCMECHNNPSDFTIFTCISCHEHDQAEMDDEHGDVGGYIYESAACLDCHPTGDADEGFDHNLSNFPLTGAHITTDCAQCHSSGFAGTPTDCYACHQPDYETSVDPGHPGLGLSTSCELCHTTDPGWAPALFNQHNDYYALTGAHTTISCINCHSNGYTGTPNECLACHQTDYQGSLNPGHPGLGLSTSCETCHTTNPGWAPATFSVHNNYYALIGAHSAIANDCAACHNGNYINTPNTCFGCHQDDYNQTNDPSHLAAQFPTDCELCHTQNVWEPSTFNHDGLYFPIYSGKHNGEWNSCIDCHTNPANYNVFSCIDCHEHNQAEMDNEHNEVSGYVYNSIACYECHPDGQTSAFRNIRNSKQEKERK